MENDHNTEQGGWLKIFNKTLEILISLSLPEKNLLMALLMARYRFQNGKVVMRQWEIADKANIARPVVNRTLKKLIDKKIIEKTTNYFGSIEYKLLINACGVTESYTSGGEGGGLECVTGSDTEVTGSDKLHRTQGLPQTLTGFPITDLNTDIKKYINTYLSNGINDAPPTEIVHWFEDVYHEIGNDSKFKISLDRFKSISRRYPTEYFQEMFHNGYVEQHKNGKSQINKALKKWNYDTGKQAIITNFSKALAKKSVLDYLEKITAKKREQKKNKELLKSIKKTISDWDCKDYEPILNQDQLEIINSLGGLEHIFKQVQFNHDLECPNKHLIGIFIETHLTRGGRL